MGLKHVDTPYLLVLDPDLFVTCPHWIVECLDHRERRRLRFFGVPWHARWYRKWRGFPCVHFLLIDLRQVDIGELDFTPDIVKDEARRPCGTGQTASSDISSDGCWFRQSYGPFGRPSSGCSVDHGCCLYR